MSKHIQLSIADPCHENWDNMTPAARGKFCGSCQKQVIDFSNMSDREVAQFFKKPSTGSVCGRFMQDQLDRSIEIPRKRIPWVKYFFQFALPAFLVSLKASAQKERPLIGKVAQICMPQLTGDIGIRIIEEPVIDTMLIKGKVIDEKGTPIPFASVIIKGTNIGTAANDSGIFSMSLKPEMKDTVVVVSSVGFESKEINIKPDEPKNLNIKLSANQILGEVIVTSGLSRRMGGLTWVTSIVSTQTIFPSIFKMDSVKIYPNPVLSGSTINLEVLKSGKGKTLIELYNIAGQKIHSTVINMSTKNWRAQMPLPTLISGTYIVNVYSDEKKKTYSTKLIVQ